MSELFISSQPEVWIIVSFTVFLLTKTLHTKSHKCIAAPTVRCKQESEKINSQDSLQRLHLSTGLGTLQCPRMSWKRWFGWGKSGLLCSDGCPHDPNPDKELKKDGWILRWIQSTSFLFTLEDDNTNQKSKFIHFSKTHEAVTVCVCVHR